MTFLPFLTWNWNVLVLSFPDMENNSFYFFAVTLLRIQESACFSFPQQIRPISIYYLCFLTRNAFQTMLLDFFQCIYIFITVLYFKLNPVAQKRFVYLWIKQKLYYLCIFDVVVVVKRLVFVIFRYIAWENHPLLWVLVFLDMASAVTFTALIWFVYEAAVLHLSQATYSNWECWESPSAGVTQVL